MRSCSNIFDLEVMKKSFLVSWVLNVHVNACGWWYFFFVFDSYDVLASFCRNTNHDGYVSRVIISTGTQFWLFVLVHHFVSRFTCRGKYFTKTLKEAAIYRYPDTIFRNSRVTTKHFFPFSPAFSLTIPLHANWKWTIPCHA